MPRTKKTHEAPDVAPQESHEDPPGGSNPEAWSQTTLRIDATMLAMVDERAKGALITRSEWIRAAIREQLGLAL